VKQQTLSERIAEACKNHDIMGVLGLTENRPLIVCPLPQHAHKRNTPSFSIFWWKGKQRWRCHGSCDLEGDVVDLIGYMRVPGYDKRDLEKIRQALALINERFEVSIPEPVKEVVLTGREYLDFLPAGEEAIQYAASRGLNEETVKRFRLGQMGHHMTIPLFEEGMLKGIKMRNMHKCDPDRRFFQMAGSRLGLFNYDHVNLRTGPVLVVKGEIPAMLLHQMGYAACAPTAGEGSYKGQTQRWTGALALASVIVIGDNDEPGRVLGKKRSIMFGGMLFFPPEQFKDIDAWILADREHAVESIQRWIEKAVSNY
jgi:DNA primase